MFDLASKRRRKTLLRANLRGGALATGYLSGLRSYWQLTKPKVVAAIVFTTCVGMLLASRSLPRLDLVLLACAGIWLAAASAAALNHVIDRKFDAAMRRTRRRPLPSGQLTQRAALVFAIMLGLAAMTILVLCMQ